MQRFKDFRTEVAEFEKRFESSRRKMKIFEAILGFGFILVFSLVVFLIGSVAWNHFFGIREGTIVSKDFVPAHSETFSSFNSTTNTWDEDEIFVPDAWYVTIEAKGEDNKVRRNRLSVTQLKFEKHNLGDWIDLK